MRLGKGGATPTKKDRAGKKSELDSRGRMGVPTRPDGRWRGREKKYKWGIEWPLPKSRKRRRLGEDFLSGLFFHH